MVAEARPGVPELELPEPIELAEARRAATHFPGQRDHPFASCFVCGTRHGDERLHLYVGPISARTLMAGPWTPAARFASPHGAVRSEVVWAALDCPAIWGLALSLERGAPEQVVSGRITVALHGVVAPEEPHVVVGWPRSRDGRKLHCAAALFTAAGELRAVAAQTCVVTDYGVPLGRWGMKSGSRKSAVTGP